MSTYTTQLRYICEQYAGRITSADYKETPAVIAAARPKIFDFSYPIYDTAYKTALETKIINHYYLREIGAETAAEFKFMLARTLNEIMPYYNKLYKTADMEFNPFYDVDYFKDHKGSGEESRQKTETGSGKTSDSNVFSGTTQTETSGERNTTIESETTRTANTTDTRTLNTQDQTTFNTTDQRTLNTTDTKTLNTKDTVRQSDTPQGALTGIESNNYLSSASITDKTGTETIGRTGTDTGQKTGTETMARTGTDTLRRTGTDTTAAEETQDATESSTSTQESESTTTGSGTNSHSLSGAENINGTDQYLDHVYGKMGSATYSALLQEYRETLINIDMMVINELEICFMNIY